MAGRAQYLTAPGEQQLGSRAGADHSRSIWAWSPWR